MKVLLRALLTLFGVLLLLYVGAVTFLYLKQRDFQYSAGGEVTALSETALTNAQSVLIPTGEGVSLAGWFQPPATGRPVVLFFKGNTGSFSAEHERYEAFVADGYGFLAFDYRGFPATPGTLSEDRILEDALAAFDWLAPKDFPVVLWGRSLGTGPATYVASRRDADALLLETPFLSAVSVGQETYWFMPVSLVMLDQFRSNEWMADVTELVFVAHGTADRTIAVSHGERLYALAPHKYDLWIEPDAGHSDLWDRGLWARAKVFFEDAQRGARNRQAAR